MKLSTSKPAYVVTGFSPTHATIKKKPGCVPDDEFYHMIQWHRGNAFAKPGESKKFYYRLVGEKHILERGLRKMFSTGLGQYVNLGEMGRTGISKPKKCTNSNLEGYYCLEDYFELPFPVLRPKNEHNVTVLKIKDKLKGYLSDVGFTFLHGKWVFTNRYKVFVNYELGQLKCAAMIRLVNCARTKEDSSNFVFNRKDDNQIYYDVKYLEDGALSNEKENRRLCTAEDTTWVWTWSKIIAYACLFNKCETDEVGKKYEKLRVFGKYTMNPGTYRITLMIKRISRIATNENFDECYFQVKLLPLVATIEGGDVRKIIKDNGVNLIGIKSYDPNEPSNNQGSLRLLWTCQCLTKQIPNCENTCKKEGKKWIHVEEEFYKPGSELQYNAEYKFILYVSSILPYDKSIMPKSSSVIIRVASANETEVINYQIVCIQNCRKEATLANEILFLKVKSVSGNQSLELNATTVFDWGYSKQDEHVLNPVDSITLANLPRKMLAIKENALEAGTSYLIGLKDHISQEVVAQYSFTTVSMKYEGTCKVEPPSGIKGLTSFDIICDNFNGLDFEFYDKNEEDLAEKVVFNGRMLGSSEYSGVLKDIRITRGNIEIYIIQKQTKLFIKKDVKVELSNWTITDEVMKTIMENLTSAVRLENLPTTMNYISFIPDIMPASADKSKILDLLLKPISQVRLTTVDDVKLSASTLKIVLHTLNKPTPIPANLGLIWKTLDVIQSQSYIIGRAVKQRDTSQWMSSSEIKLVAKALLDCLNAALKCQSARTAGMSEEYMNFDEMFMLRKVAQRNGEILDHIKDILCYIQAPGLPPATLATSDKAFQVWAMGDDEDNPVSKMLQTERTIPFATSKNLLNTYSQGEKFGTDLFFQAALIDRNVFSWSKSDVKSKLVSISIATKKKGKDLQKIALLSSPIHVKISMEKNLTNTTVKGSAMQLDPRMVDVDPMYLDGMVQIHRIYVPPKGYVTIRFLFPPTKESLRVLLLEDYRPDYALLTTSKDTVIISASNPEYPIKHRAVDVETFLYMAILPGKNVTVKKTVDYEFQVTLNLCQLWIDGQWSTLGCGVSAMTTSEETVCVCNHLSIFAAAFPVPPQSIDPIGDIRLFLTVLDNPLVVVFVIILFIIYLLLILWGRYKDNIDRYKGRVVVLEDNFPEDPYPYLVAVHTSARFNSGTTAHVGIKLEGKLATSRAHILSSQRRRVLTRNSDDWFMLYSPKALGDIYGVHVWHDNYGSSPEWYCEKIVVYDLSERTEFVFIVQQWLDMRLGDYPEAHLSLATNADMLSIKRMFLDNSILGFRDSHTYLSVFVRHPRSGVTRVQRVSILMCSVMIAMLCSIMFYKPDDDESYPTDDFQYDVGTRELIISIETAAITGCLTLIVMQAFKRSYKIRQDQHQRTTRHFRKDDVGEKISKESIYLSKSLDRIRGKDKTFFDNYVNYVSKYLKSPPLGPVHIWEHESNVQKRKVWYTIAWTSCIVITICSAYLVMLYGLKLGLVNSQEWLTSLVMSMSEDIFVMGPGRIIFLSILVSIAFQVATKVDLHEISVKDAMLARPKNELHYLNILLSKRSHPMYAPLSSSARMVQMNKKETRRKWWNLIDFINAVFFVVVVSVVIRRLWISHYHGVNHLNNVFAEAHKKEFGSVDMINIKNISLVEQYLEVNFVEVIFDLWWYNQRLLTDGDTLEGIFKYWIEDGIHKPISKPLVRQVRVVPNNCTNEYFNSTTCLLKWSLVNKDDNDYGEKWVPATFLDTTKKDFPWLYRERSTPLWWLNQRFYGTYGTLYDASGYDTFAGPTLKEAQRTLAELKANEWQDWYTRACFLQVTVYNVNDQTFSQVTLLFEYFVDGSMNASVTVIPVSRIILLGVWEVLFFFYAIYYFFRSAHLINRMGLMDYIKTINNISRLVVVFLSVQAIIIWCDHHRTSIIYSEEYMKKVHGDFFDFDMFRSTFSALQFVLSLLLCFAIARSFMLLRGGRKMLNTYYAVLLSLFFVFWLFVIFILLLFICDRVKYYLNCQNYFKVKEEILPQKMTAYVKTNLFEKLYVDVFVSLRAISMFFVHAFFVVLFLHYIRIAKVYKLRGSDSFNFVPFVLERLKKCYGRRSIHN